MDEAVLDRTDGAEHAHGLFLRRVAFVYAVHSFQDQLLGELRAGGFVFDQDVPGGLLQLFLGCNIQRDQWSSMQLLLLDYFAMSLGTHTVCYHRRKVESTAYRRSNLWKDLRAISKLRGFEQRIIVNNCQIYSEMVRSITADK